MYTIELVLVVFAAAILVLTRFALLRLHQPTTPVVWMIKVLTSALSPVLFITCLLLAGVGSLLDSLPLLVLGCSSALLFFVHIVTISRPPASSTGFENAFGQQRLLIETEESSFLSRRYMLLLPRSQEPNVERDVLFYRLPDSTRGLICDVWTPPKNVKSSGLAFIYLHGSAWTVLDKDCGTRPFFRHLASQGHVIMDVAYRLFPETDFGGMVNDAKHAIAWMKASATSYDVDSERIVIGGGSAGAHIALLAAYSQSKSLVSEDLQNSDLSVLGVISLYGPTDLAATYYHQLQQLHSNSVNDPNKSPNGGAGLKWLQKRMGKDFYRLGFDKNVEPGMLAPMLGGTPVQKPDQYSLYSPIQYVNPFCPPTLILHGDQDILVPLTSSRALQSKLTAAGVPVVMHEMRQADHAFDLFLPRISPAAHNAIYDVERFLALLNKKVTAAQPAEEWAHHH